MLQKPIPLSKQIENLASAYYAEYKVIGGNVGKKRIINDCRILACASLKGCQIIASDDSHMRESSKLVAARDRINARKGIGLPRIITYSRLKNIIGLSSA